MVVFQLSVILCGFLIPVCYAKDYWYVVAPNVFRLNHEETLVAGILGTGSGSVQIKLLLNDVEISQHQAAVRSQDNSDKFTMKVTAENVFQYQELAGPRKKDQKPTHVSLVADFPDGSRSTREVVIGYKSGYLIVQTDKPLYTPREGVNVRVLAMDESLKPIRDQKVYIDIRTPSSDLAGDTKVMAVDRKTFFGSKNGFYRHKFTLPPYPQIGEWTVKAFLAGKYDTETIVPFEVKEFVLPTFEVKITSQEAFILENTEQIKVKVDARYVYGKNVQGSAGLKFRIVEDSGAENDMFNISRKELTNGLTEFTINVRDLIKARGRGFPDNARLFLEADVIEDATGKEEKSSEDFLVFTKSPFRFDFSRSKNTYRTGMIYHLQIEMTYVNGRKAANQTIKIRYYDRNEERKMTRDEYTTDDRGQLVAPVSTGDQQQTLQFHVHPIDYPGETTDYYVKPYIGNNQMVLENVKRYNEHFALAFTNMNPVGQFTGIMIMIISRGEIVNTLFYNPTNIIIMRMDNHILKKVSPGARLLAFYVDKTGHEIVADSTKFAVDPMCRGEPLKVKTDTATLDPGASCNLTVTGPSDMWVGFNVMDKASFSLNSASILKHDTIFQALDSHDLGCGAGSGQTSEEIFKNAGLTILTNANADNAALTRNSDHCDKAKLRDRRSVSKLKCHPEMQNCCHYGEVLAERLLEWKENKLEYMNIEVDINPRDDCMTKAMAIRRETYITHSCISSMYRFCLERLTTELTGKGRERRSIFPDDEQYRKDLNMLLELGHSLRVRSNFEASFFFEEHQLQNGIFEKRVKFRDSITEWSIQAIGISATEGACIAESVDVKTYQPFFIQLDLPYKATRFERFIIKVTVFNNYDQTQNVSVYLKGADGLCYGTSPGQNSPRTLVELEHYGAKTVSFSAIPLVAGDIPITVSVFISSNSTGKSDFISKKLHVENEGIMETIQIHACLDPNSQMEACMNSPQVTADDPLYKNDRQVRTYELDLTLPAIALTGTGTATAYIETDIMDPLIPPLLDWVDTMFREPNGNGETVMIYTSPIVYGMYYLKMTGLETTATVEQGTKWIKHGIRRERSEFQNEDGSFVRWYPSQKSLWLTTFVAKVFCQAEKLLDGVVVKESLQRTLKYIADNQKLTGNFVDNGPIRRRSIQGVLGQGDRKEDPSMTSFVLIALQECPEREVDESVTKAIGYLENLPHWKLQQNKFSLAITTYSLALTDSQKKWELRDILLNAANKRDDMTYWSDHNGNEATIADVETTAYALLAFLKFDDIRTSGKIVTWLTDQGKLINIYSTQATVIALQALAEYSVRTYNREVNLDIEIKNGQTLHRVSVTNDNALLKNVIPELLVKGQNNILTVTANGNGAARMNIELRWNRNAISTEKCHYVSSIEIDHVDPIFSGSSKERFKIKDESTVRIHIGTLFAKSTETVPSLHMHRSFSAENKSAMDNNPVNVYSTDERSGTGYLFAIDFLHHRPCDVCGRCTGDDIERLNDRIDVNDIKAKTREADDDSPQKCIIFQVNTFDGDESHNVSIVKVNLESEVRAIEDDFKELMMNGVIDRYEMPKDGESFVMFYINKISEVTRKFMFRLEDHFQGSTASRQPATVVIYDYYKPEQKCIRPYSISEYHGLEVGYRCNEDNDQCKCLLSQCSSPVEEELVDYIVKFKSLSYAKKARMTKPSHIIAQYACNFGMANFVYNVTIKAISVDELEGMKYATAVINEIILAGKEHQHQDDEITLEWKRMCKHPQLKEGKTYYIVGKDPTIYNRGGYELMARYELMGTTLVIDPSYNPMLRTVMDRFESQMMKTYGCFH